MGAEDRYERYCKELEALNKKVRRKLKQIEEVKKKIAVPIQTENIRLGESAKNGEAFDYTVGDPETTEKETKKLNTKQSTQK